MSCANVLQALGENDISRWGMVGLHVVSYGLSATKGASIVGAALGTASAGTLAPVGVIIGAVGGVAYQYAVDTITDEGIHMIAKSYEYAYPSLTNREAEALALTTVVGYGGVKAVKEYVKKNWGSTFKPAMATAGVDVSHATDHVASSNMSSGLKTNAGAGFGIGSGLQAETKTASGLPSKLHMSETKTPTTNAGVNTGGSGATVKPTIATTTSTIKEASLSTAGSTLSSKLETIAKEVHTTQSATKPATQSVQTTKPVVNTTASAGVQTKPAIKTTTPVVTTPVLVTKPVTNVAPPVVKPVTPTVNVTTNSSQVAKPVTSPVVNSAVNTALNNVAKPVTGASASGTTAGATNVVKPQTVASAPAPTSKPVVTKEALTGAIVKEASKNAVKSEVTNVVKETQKLGNEVNKTEELLKKKI